MKFGPEYTGRRFGKLVALSRAPNEGTKHGLWFFLCDCGKQITRPMSQVHAAKLQSCGGNGCKHVNREFVTHKGWAVAR